MGGGGDQGEWVLALIFLNLSLRFSSTPPPPTKKNVRKSIITLKFVKMHVSHTDSKYPPLPNPPTQTFTVRIGGNCRYREDPTDTTS